MDNFTRWSIGLGAGIFAGLAALGAHHVVTSDARQQSYSYAVDQLVPNYAELDVVVEFDTYDTERFVTMAQLLQDADVPREIGCGGYPNPAHVCATDATIPGGLRLINASADVVRDDYSLTVGEYRSEYEEILARAASVLVDTGTGLRPVTYEGGGRFTLGYLGHSPSHGQNEPWQFALAAVPILTVWLGAGALAALVTVLVTGCFRPREEPEVEEVGVEFFDELEGEDDRG